MDKETYLFLVLTSSLGIFLILTCLNLEFYSRHSIPIGMSDVDRYVSWLGLDISDRTDFSQLTRKVALTHGFFIYTVYLLGGVYALNWFIPFLISCGGILTYFLYKGMGFDDKTSFLGFLFMVFASFYLVGFYFMALWAQLYSFFWFLLSLNFLERNKKFLGVFFALLSVAAHYMVIGVWALLLLAELYRKKRYILSTCLASSIVAVAVYERFLPFLTFFSERQPGAYEMMAIWSFPLVWVFVFFAPLESYRHRFLIGLLSFTFFLEFGRGLFYLSLFVSPMAAKGFLELLKNCRLRFFFIVFVFLFWIFWFSHSLQVIFFNMFEEAVLRGLTSEQTFKSLFY